MVEPFTELASTGKEQALWGKLVDFILNMKSDQLNIQVEICSYFSSVQIWRLGMRSKRKVQI